MFVWLSVDEWDVYDMADITPYINIDGLDIELSPDEFINLVDAGIEVK